MISVMPVPLLSVHPREYSQRGHIRYVPSVCAYRWTCRVPPHMGKRRIASTAGVCTLCDFRLGKQGTAVPTLHTCQYVKTYLASNARVDTHRAFCKFQPCCLLQKLVGQHPKPFNDFFKIGYAPVELNITLSWKVM